MPLRRRTLTRGAVAQVSAAAFEPSPGQYLGLELEWPVHRHDDVGARPRSDDVARMEGTVLPAGGRISFEPGGQVELSTAPARCVSQALLAAEVDARALDSQMQAAGFVCETVAVDARRPPLRILERPRYQAMERFFAEQGPAGAWMMCNTASTQVNISHDQQDPYQRWYTMHLIAPVLVAAFANSSGPDANGRHWTSLRQGIWASIDPLRTRPVGTDLAPEQAWEQYALGADVMFIRSEGGDGHGGTAVRPGLSFGRWMADGHPVGWPTIEDYRYHLSTLFPPVRPRGWLELRMLDALPAWVREVAVLTVAAACTTDASRELHRRLPDMRGLWFTAARYGINHPLLASAARVLTEVVADNLGSVSRDTRHAQIVDEFATRYVRACRSPGHDLVSATWQPCEDRSPALA